MRLIELRLKNLNSLKGEWHIDFSDAAFINEGIFAITGQTGAGKTTILDAICLALYGETPRINSISKSSNEVMTRQTAECFAEVVIDLNGSQYRCRWGQRRAYSKADGNLQDATHEIAKLNLDLSKEAEILESKLLRTRDKIIELTRMDFQQFTRSILLAQGSFSAFLKAKADERADILEKITGTDIYATISEQVYEKKRSEEEILSKLQFGLEGLTLLDSDEEAALSKSLATNQSAQDKQQLALTQLTEQINWLDALSELQRKLIAYNSDLATAKQTQQDFIPDAFRLNTANKALELDGQYSQLNFSRDVVKNLSTEQQAVTDNILTQQANFEQVIIQLNTVNKLTEKSNNELQITLPILAQVRTLDADIKQQTHSLTDNTQRKDNLATNIEYLSQEIASYVQLQADSESQSLAISKFLDQHNEHNDLDTDIATFDSNGSRLKTLLQDNANIATDQSAAMQQAGQLQVELNQLNEQQATDKLAMSDTRNQYLRLQEQQAALIAKQPLSQIRGEQEQIEQINNTVEQVNFKLQQLAEINVQSKKLTLALPSLSEELAATTHLIAKNVSAISDAKAKRQDQQTHLNLLQKVAKLEDYIVELQDNSPCPLCGALEHPYAKHHPILQDSKDSANDQSMTFQTQRQIKELDAQIDELQQTLSTQQVERATKQNSIDQQQQQLTLLNNQMQTISVNIQNGIASLFGAAVENKNSVYTDALTPIIEPLKNIVSIDDTESILSAVKEQLSQQKQHLKLTLSQYEALTEELVTIGKSIENEEQQRFVQASAISAIETDIKLNQQQLASFNKQTKNNFSELQALSTGVLTLINKYPANKYETHADETLTISEQLHKQLYSLKNSLDAQTIFNEAEVEQHIHYLRQQRSYLLQLRIEFNTKKDQQQTLKMTLSNVQTQIETRQALLDAEEIEHQKIFGIVVDGTQSLLKLKNKRQETFANKNPDDEENRLRTALEQAKTEQNAAQRSYDNTAQTLAQLQEKQQRLSVQLESTTATLNIQQSDFATALASSQFDSEASFVAARLPMDIRNALKAEQQQIDYALKQAQSLVKQTEQTLTDKQSNPLTFDNRETLASQQQQTQMDNKRLLETIGAMRERLKDNSEKKDNQQEQHEAINAQKDKLQVWRQLNELIGSASGKKYRTFAQGLTFDIMVSHANTQLHKMSDRYLLIRDDNNALELNVIDNYQGGEIRSTKNLSGGEGFIISLALALGLSQMASQNIRVDSLFLDEGFGTLDDESLDIALYTLTSLQHEGKLIGVFSHV